MLEEIKQTIQTEKPFEIKVTTKSSCDKIYMENGIIKVKIREIPEDGKAKIKQL